MLLSSKKQFARHRAACLDNELVVYPGLSLNDVLDMILVASGQVLIK